MDDLIGKEFKAIRNFFAVVSYFKCDEDGKIEYRIAAFFNTPLMIPLETTFILDEVFDNGVMIKSYNGTRAHLISIENFKKYMTQIT